MAIVSVTKLRNGTLFEYKDHPWRVTDYKHVHMSRGAGTINVKAKNLVTGHTQNLTFKSGEKIEETQVERRRLTYLYKDDNSLQFMDPVSFEQVEIGQNFIDNEGDFLVDGQETVVIYWEGAALGIELPPKVTLAIQKASPGVKGDTVGAATKDAVLETGKKIRVPLFIKDGDRVVVDTRDGKYVERAN